MHSLQNPDASLVIWLILKDGRLLCPLLLGIHVVCGLHIHHVLCRRCSPARVKSLGLDTKVQLENNSPVFSLGSQLHQETASLIVPIVVVMANSP